MGCGKGEFLSELEQDVQFTSTQLIGVDFDARRFQINDSRIVYHESLPTVELNEGTAICAFDFFEHVQEIKSLFISLDTSRVTLIIGCVPVSERASYDIDFN